MESENMKAVEKIVTENAGHYTKTEKDGSQTVRWNTNRKYT